MEFRILGRLEVEAEGADLTPVRRQQLTALGLLLLHPGDIVSVDELVDTIWGEHPPSTVQTALQGLISALRKRLGTERVETRPPGYLLRLGSDDVVDAHRFERLTAEAHCSGPLLREQKLSEALALFRGEPLADFRYESFAGSERHRLDELRLDALEERIEVNLQLGRHAGVLPDVERLVAEHPLRERLRGQLMLALYRAGRQPEALEAFVHGRRVLRDEYGVDPSRALRLLERQILNHDAVLADPDTFSSSPDTTGRTRSGTATFMVARGCSDRDLMRTVLGQHNGNEVRAHHASLLVSFTRARDAVGAAVGLERVTRSRVRIGIHSAAAPPSSDALSTVGERAAAGICDAAHAGQILLSQSTYDLLRETPWEDAALRNLGLHRLNDLRPAANLYQLLAPGLPHDFPPPLSLDTRATNLPVHATTLVGREAELREVAARLTCPEAGIVTLIGPGGTGKTRLATQAAAALLDEFSDGVFFVDLAPLADSRLVLPSVARTLGLGEVSGRALSEALVRHLRDRRFLLVLDNFEHLLEAGPVLAELVAAAHVRVLVTSRVPVGVPRETTYPVDPLPTPEGVAMFRACARAARPDFDVTPSNAAAVTDICQALDGLPLAIELAASRVTVLPPAALLARLDRPLRLLNRRSADVPARHLGMRAAMDWSYELLHVDDQILFRRLATFSGGCSLEAAERVCGDGVDVVEGLSSLVDASLVRLEGTDEQPRFGMLQTIREYAAEVLDESSETEELTRRHATHFLSLAQEAESHLRGDPGPWLERLEREHDNLRVALRRATTSGRFDFATELAGALWRFWYLKGHLSEGRRNLEEVLANDPRPAASRSKALLGAAVMALNSGDRPVARRRAEEAMVLSERLGDAWGAAYAGFMMGSAFIEDDPRRARSLLGASADAFGQIGDSHSLLLVSRNLAALAEQLHPEQARGLHEDNLRLARDTGNPRIEASTLGSLATIALDEGRLDDACAMLRESIRLHQILGDRLDTTVDLCRAAVALVDAHRARTAVLILGSLDALRQDEASRRTWREELNDRALAAAREQLEAAAFADAWEQGGRLSAEDALDLALTQLP